MLRSRPRSLHRLKGLSTVLLGATLPLAACGGGRPPGTPREDASLPAPEAPPGTVLFVTQTPICGFGTVTSTFGNHRGQPNYARRGGDLMIRYPEGGYDPSRHPGGLRNLTREAGFGVAGFQGAGAIAVREPAMHWDGQRAVFAMAVGGSVGRYDTVVSTFQLYEVTGLGPDETARITKVPNQPEGYDNVSPTYGSDDAIFFVSDRPARGAHLHPLLDEYELNPVVEGIYRLRPDGELTLVEHSPSGSFSPFVDSHGRVIFTKWDHLRMDGFGQYGGIPKGGVNFPDESPGAVVLPGLGDERFPERPNAPGSVYVDAFGRSVHTHDFNQFMPWEMNEDGSHEETQNHVGRHELGGSFAHEVFPDDSSLSYLNPVRSSIANQVFISGSAGLFHIRESPVDGRFCATYAPEFSRASAGQILCYDAEPSRNAEDVALRVLTSPDPTTSPNGLFRNPIQLASGAFLASHTRIGPQARPADNVQDCVENFVEDGTGPAGEPRSRLELNYAFRVRTLAASGELLVAGAPMTAGIEVSISWYDGSGALRTYAGPLFELDAVEVAARPRPSPRVAAVEEPERRVVDAVLGPSGKTLDDLVTWMRARDLALVVVRDLTSRDRADRAQPFNLAVQGGVATVGGTGTVYTVAALELFQGDRVRGYDPSLSMQAYPSPIPGRRILAVPMHDAPLELDAPGTSDHFAPVSLDGSVAAFVPARRALTWQSVGADGRPVVRERNWVDFAPGEIRTCPSCHGVNRLDQAGNAPPTSEPEALRALLLRWLAQAP